MTGRVEFDSEHVRRVGVRFSAFAEDLSDLVRRLADDLAAGAQWPGQHGGAVFSATWAELTAALSTKERVIVGDLDDAGSYLRRQVTKFEDIDDRAESALRGIGRGL